MPPWGGLPPGEELLGWRVVEGTRMYKWSEKFMAQKWFAKTTKQNEKRWWRWKAKSCRSIVRLKNINYNAVVPKLGINYLPGVICDYLGGNAEPNPYCCSLLRAITAKEIFDKKCKKILLGVI